MLHVWFPVVWADHTPGMCLQWEWQGEGSLGMLEKRDDTDDTPVAFSAHPTRLQVKKVMIAVSDPENLVE